MPCGLPLEAVLPHVPCTFPIEDCGFLMYIFPVEIYIPALGWGGRDPLYRSASEKGWIMARKINRSYTRCLAYLTIR